MSCPDWRALSLDSRETEDWSEALAHFDSVCMHCRRDALKVDPTLVFRGLRAAPAPAAGSASMGSTSSEVDAMCQAVAAMRAAHRVDSVEHRSHPAWKRWAVAAGLVLAALSIPADNAWKRREQAVTGRPAAAAILGAVMPAALVGGMGEIDLPTVEGVNHPDARVYHMDGEGLSVVMIVDESLDV
jgi:hypothetical protein